MTLDSLYILLAIQYAFWAVVFLFVRKENKLANFFFGAYLLMQGSMFYYFYQAYSGNYSVPSLYLQLYWIASATHTPLLFLYIVHFLKNKRIELYKLALHFTPAILLTSVFIGYYLLLDEEGKIELTKIHMSGESHNYLSIYLYSHILLASQNIYYIVESVRYVLKYQKNICRFSANIPCKQIKWLKQLIFLSQFINIGGFVVFDLIPTTPALRFYPAIHLVLIYFIMYKAVNQSEIFKHHSSTNFPQRINVDTYSSNINFQHIIDTIKSLLVTHRLYTDKSLTILHVSTAVKTPVEEIVSALENSSYNNFYGLVSTVRISQVQSPSNIEIIENRSVEDIAESFGFSSVKELEVMYKKHTGSSFLSYKTDLITEDV